MFPEAMFGLKLQHSPGLLWPILFYKACAQPIIQFLTDSNLLQEQLQRHGFVNGGDSN